MCLVTGGSLKSNCAFKRHKKIVLVPTPLPSLFKHPHIGSFVGSVRPFFIASPSPGSAESSCWG